MTNTDNQCTECLPASRTRARGAAVYRAHSPLEAERVRALAACSFLPGSSPKRFARNMAAALQTGITDRQAALLESYCWQFRRQMPARLVPASDPRKAKR